MKTKRSSTSSLINTKTSNKFIRRFSDLSGISENRILLLIRALQSSGAEITIESDRLETSLSTIPIISFDTSLSNARISASPLMMKIYAYESKQPMRAVFESIEILKGLFCAKGNDPMYLNIQAVFDHIPEFALLVRRLKIHD